MKLNRYDTKQKELLLKDLCARLPYKVRCKVDKINFEGELREIELSYNMARLYNVENDESENVYVYDCKPYLFPLSSMTEEQKKECFKGTPLEIDKYGNIGAKDDFYGNSQYTDLEIYLEVINWLLKNNFDIYGLIPMGAANDATRLK